MYDLTKHFLADKKQILSKIESVLNRGILEMGEEVEQFEENFKKYCGVKYLNIIHSIFWFYGLTSGIKIIQFK